MACPLQWLALLQQLHLQLLPAAAREMQRPQPRQLPGLRALACLCQALAAAAVQALAQALVQALVQALALALVQALVQVLALALVQGALMRRLPASAPARSALQLELLRMQRSWSASARERSALVCL